MAASKVRFTINGNSYAVDPTTDKHISNQTRLVDYIREHAKLTGTKYMCREGGCGACVVSVRQKLTSSDKIVTKAVNSCLIPILSCDGWSIFTVESLGNQKDGYHPIQEKLVKFGGTQCGYCSPGMVMSMYSALESNPLITVQEVEDSFDGNICRCTGYRPILDAFKSLASDAPKDLKQKCCDIEDLKGCSLSLNGKLPTGCSMENGQLASDSTCGAKKCCKSEKTPSLSLDLNFGEKWVKANSLEQAFSAIESFKSLKINYRIVAGNTSTGIYKNDELNFNGFLDIASIPELCLITYPTSESNEFVLGGGITLSECIRALEKISMITGFQYADQMSKHIKRIANAPVRNVGTLAGNLMIKHNHREFPSDLFAILECVGAKLKIASGKCSVLKLGSTTTTTQIGLADFLYHEMKDSLIVSIHLRPVNSNYIYRSFKITKRYQNAHAYVNAGFFMEVDKSNNYKVLSKPSIVYGGIHPNFVHAEATETFLTGKHLSEPSSLEQALIILEKEVNPDYNLPDATPEYRKQLTASLLYKVILHILGSDSSKILQSGGNHIEHLMTSGRQSYQSDKEDWPLNKPVTKLEAVAQVSGEAEYINDIPSIPKECFGHLLYGTIGNCNFKIVDTSEALNIQGVIGFYLAKDIPGENSYYTPIIPGFPCTPEKVFAEGRIEYAGQPIGIILAETKDIAIEATKKIKIEYFDRKPPILKIKDALKTFGDKIPQTAKSLAEGKVLEDVGIRKGTIKGEFNIGSQYHFHMETQQAIVIPKEGCLEVFSSTQWLDFVQTAISRVLKISNSKINMAVKRVGGGFGAKCSRAALVASACSVGAYLSNRPVRLILDMESNMEIIGKRSPYLANYEVDYDVNGKILRMELDIYNDGGYAANEEFPLSAQLHVQNCYKANNFTMGGIPVTCNVPGSTACRAPGTTQGIAIMENIMEHIAFELNKDPLDVRSQNWLEPGDSIFSYPHPDKLEGKNFAVEMCQEIYRTAEFEERKRSIEKFNKENRWFKRGIALVPMRYKFDYEFPLIYNSYVSIYHGDGTVGVSHCGIEIGQGINTKVAQAVAYRLGINIENVSVKATNNFISANAGVTGGSFTSELCCHSAVMACEKILERMEPFKKENPTWADWVNACHTAGVDLTHNYVYHYSRDKLKGYNIWAANVTEVEVDVLTGEHKIVRVDLLEDAGKALNPEIDVGQVEGALVMGLGLWTNEKLVYDKNTGRLLTKNTWEYKAPLPKDIPEDMRISFLSNAPNPQGVLRSKATGEPPLCTSVTVLFALKNAIIAARKDAGNEEWFQLDGPVTAEDILRLSLSTPDKFQLH